MKMIITVALCLALVACNVQAGTTNNPAQHDPNSGILVCLMVGCVLAGAVCIIYLYQCTNVPQERQIKVALDKSNDNVNWTPVITNTVTLHGTNMIEFFRAEMIDDTLFYRARWVHPDTQVVIGRLENPVIQTP